MGMYNIMFYGGLILAIIFLIASVVIFFVMKIPKSFGVVTGNTQRKAIEEIRSGDLGASGRKRNRVLGGSGSIQARDIDMSDALKKSGILDRNKRDYTSNIKRSSDASSDLAKKAAEDAAKAAAASTAGAKERARMNLDEESTEVLTYNDMVNKGGSEDTTTILENEQATDVLTAGGDDYEAEDYTDEKIYDDDDSTDVLTSKSDIKKDTSYDDEATDVLRRTSDTDLYDDDLDEDYDAEVDKTDVLTADVSGLDESAIYGTYNPEMTAVLRSDMVPGEDSVENGPRKDLPGITVIYSETIVHTDESL